MKKHFNSPDIYKWFLESELYDKELEAYRIFYSKRKKGPVYPEITAYAINLACILHKESGDIEFIHRAKSCAEYLLKLSKDGLTGHSDNIKYSFDTGIFISALFDLYEVTKIGKYIEEAYIRLEWLSSYFDGEKFPAIIGNGVNKNWHNESWDKISSVHLAKLAIPFLKGFQELKHEKYKSIVLSLLNWAMKLQNDEGRFRINQHNDNTSLHPHCYAVEGFLFASQCINEGIYWKVAKKASDWLHSVQNKNGSFYQWFPKFPNRSLKEKIIGKAFRSKCTDVTSQAIRIWKILGEHRKNINLAYKFLEEMKINFGLSPVIRKSFFIEIREKKNYSWPTFFYIQSRLMKFGDKSGALKIF